MTEYTPTTEAVGYAYIMHKESRSFSTRDNTPDYEDEFYRWLAEVKAEAWAEGVADRDRYDYPENPYREGETE